MVDDLNKVSEMGYKNPITKIEMKLPTAKVPMVKSPTDCGTEGIPIDNAGINFIIAKNKAKSPNPHPIPLNMLSGIPIRLF